MTELALTGGTVRPLPVLRGNIDRVEGDTVVGWAFDPESPDTAVKVLIQTGGRTLGEGVADQYLASLENAGLGNGAHGFRVCLSNPYTADVRLELSLVDADSQRAIAANTFVVTGRDPAALSTVEMDVHGLVAAPRPRIRKRTRQLQGIVRRLKRLAKRCVPVRVVQQPQPLPAGVQAKLSLIQDVSVNSLVSLPSWPRLSLPLSEKPQVSIIVPVFNQFHLTYQCLSSIIMSAGKVSFETILVDDKSTDATASIESRIDGLRVIRNEENLGFLHSCNKAAGEARGQYLLFLNNDTEVTPGWIDEMHAVFDRFDTVGAVGAKLVYPDGRLQDAGGIVWESGTPWNTGHGQDPNDPQFNYVRQVDYLTGAALMVSRPAWEAVHGFDEIYAPAYYEDTDLAFSLRQAGYRTYYCPQAEVIHYEGCSNGTSVESGVKQHQKLNADIFKSRWQAAFVGAGVEGQDLIRHKDRNIGLRVLMIDNSFPKLGHDAGSYAAIQEMELLQRLGCKITFMPNNLLHLGIHVERLQRMGIECVYTPYVKSVEGFLKQRGPEFDVVYVTRYAVAENVIDCVRNHSHARIIFNNADLHFLREMRLAHANGDDDLSGALRTRERELAVMQKVDAILSYNELEHEIIASHLLRVDNIFKCPWVLHSELRRISPFNRRDLSFLGGFAHPPNRQAMDWFCDQVMPLLHARHPDVCLHIWGSSIPADASWSNCPGVIVEGYADSLDQVFDTCRVFVAPLQSGAGVKGKVLDSISHGVPCVLSSVAAEGTGLRDGASMLQAGNPEEWVDKIDLLITNDALWQRISDDSIAVRDSLYSAEYGTELMKKVFDYLGLTTGITDQQVKVGSNG